MPKVSVVIPNYNHARFLRRRVDSVLRQTFQDFEIIILDDCSTDESRPVISDYSSDPRVRIHFNDENSGSTFKQWNKGVAMASGDYVWIAESDDYADEHLLERLVPALAAEPTAGFASCRSWRINAEDKLDGFGDFYLTDLDSQRWTADYCSEGRDECRRYFLFCNAVPNASAVLFRKSAYVAVGGADESYRMCGDWKLWASMALNGRVVYLGQPLNYFRFHRDNVRGRDVGHGILVEESLRVVRWMLGQVSISSADRQRLCHALSGLWIPAVINGRVAVPLRLRIFRSALAIDSRAARRIVQPAIVALRMKIQNLFRP